MDIRGYQMHQMAWKIRTGGDVSEFLGQCEPPERTRPRIRTTDSAGIIPSVVTLH